MPEPKKSGNVLNAPHIYIHWNCLQKTLKKQLHKKYKYKHIMNMIP